MIAYFIPSYDQEIPAEGSRDALKHSEKTFCKSERVFYRGHTSAIKVWGNRGNVLVHNEITKSTIVYIVPSYSKLLTTEFTFRQWHVLNQLLERQTAMKGPISLFAGVYTYAYIQVYHKYNCHFK